VTESCRCLCAFFATSSTGLFTTTVAVAVSQFAGLTFNLLMDWLRIMVGDAVRTTWVLAATVTIPLASMVNR
jgi:hypothetical protein